MKTAEIIRNYISSTIAVSENDCKTCRVVARKNNETILKIKFDTIPTEGEIEHTVCRIVESEETVPAALVPAIIRQVKATVVFKMKIG